MRTDTTQRFDDFFTDLRLNRIKKSPIIKPVNIDSTGNPGIATTKTVPLPPVITSPSMATATVTRRIRRIAAHVGKLFLGTTSNSLQPI